MCFSVPYKVLSVRNGKAQLEGGKNILLGKDLRVSKGDYLQVLGNMGVSKLTSAQGQKVMRLIKNIYFTP